MSRKPFSELALNVPEWDWVTCTSWHTDSFDGWIKEPDKAKQGVQRLNYNGMQEGKVFVGDGQQNGYFHRMLQVSGKDANLAVPALIHLPDIECTHLDLQITCEWQDSDIFAIAERLRDQFLVDYRTSKEGDTVYIYSRLSDKFIRIYQKTKDIVRFEVAYKKPYARGMWETLQSGRLIASDHETQEMKKSWLMWELHQLHDKTLSEVFADSLGNNPTKPPKHVPAPENNTERWLRKIVAPALLKYVNGHEADPYLIHHLVKILGASNEL